VHRIDAATGQLEYLGIAATGSQPTHLAVTPNGKFVYVSNFSSQSISGYAFDAATGTLTPVPGSPFTGVTGNLMVEIEPRGKFLYAPSYIGNAVAGFAIDQATGALSPVPGSPFAGGADS